ncbi:MAG: hypothetical protein FK730_10915 [Asgard group archaeon]|nr:hypothetical protein [Asgard group archaeon]
MKFFKNKIFSNFSSFFVILILLIVPISYSRIIHIYGIPQKNSVNPINVTSGVSIYVNETLVYIVEDYHGLDIINVSNRNEPEFVGKYEFPWGFHADFGNLIVQDDYVFFYSWDTNTITIVDCSDLTNIVMKENYTLTGDRIKNFVVKEWNIFTITNTKYTIYDFTNFSPLSTIGSYSNTSSQFADLIVQENHSYVLEAGKGLTILNITDFSNIQKAGEVILNESSSFPAFQARFDDRVFIYEKYKGLHVYNTSNPLNPENMTKYDLISGYFGGFHIRGDYAYVVTGYRSFDILDLSTLSAIQLVGNYSTEYYAWFEAITADNNYVYLLSTQSGELQGRRPLYVVDVSDPELPVHLFPGDPYKIFDEIRNILLITLGVVLAGSFLIIAVILAVHFKRTKPPTQEEMKTE